MRTFNVWRALRIIGSVLLASLLPRPGHGQEAAARLLVERAQSALDSTDVERSIDLFRRAISVLPDNAPRDLRVRVYLNLGAAHWALGERDSANTYFGQLLAADPFHQVDTLGFNPQIVRAISDLRRRTVAGALVLARDTTVPSASGALAARLRVTSPSQVVVSLARAARGAPSAIIDSFAVEDTRETAVPVRDGNGSFLPSGEYEILFSRVDSAGTHHRLLGRRVRLVLTQQDTASLEPPLPDSVLRPERRASGPGRAALVRGILLGGIAAALPFVARSTTVTSLQPGDSRAIAVGAAVAVAGFGAFVALAPGRPIAGNIRYNEALREQWRERNERTHEENAQRRAAARTRIEDLGGGGRP